MTRKKSGAPAGLAVFLQADKALKAIEKRVMDMSKSVQTKGASSVTAQDLTALDRVPRCPFTNPQSEGKGGNSRSQKQLEKVSQFEGKSGSDDCLL